MINRIVIILLMFLSTSVWAKESYLLEVSLPQEKNNGKAWDINDGPPDIFVIVDDKERFKCKNRYECEVVFRSDKKNGSFHVKILDRDPGYPDFVGEGDCNVNLNCELGRAQVKIWNYLPIHDFGNCDKELVLTFFDREYITYLSKYRAIRDYGFTIKECKYSKKTKILSMISLNWFIGSDLLNYYTSESKLIVNKDGSDPRYLMITPDTELNKTDWFVDVKRSLINKPLIINNTRVKNKIYKSNELKR